MSERTPGPWDYVPGNEHHGPYVTSEFGSTICDCYVMSKPTPWSADQESKPVPFMYEMAEPNARLIAAAPELLAALRSLHDDLAEYQRINNLGGYTNQVMVQARAAIAKAEGRS